MSANFPSIAIPGIANAWSECPVGPATAPPVAEMPEWDAVKRLKKKAKLMIIDDEELVVKVVQRFLQREGYEHFITLTDSTKAIDTILREQPDTVLMDIQMPEVTGLDILHKRRAIPNLQYTPFIILSASQDVETKQLALEMGATEFLAKPVEQIELILRVQNALIVKNHFDHLSDYTRVLEQKVTERTKLLERSRTQILQCLARAAEYRDNETGRHVMRVGIFARLIAEQLGLPASFCRQIELAAPLHDLGKIGIPDSIMLGSHKLSEAEFDIMKKHCEIGRRILDPFAAEEVELLRDPTIDRDELPESMRIPLMTMAARIAQTHHEKWDGTGYPMGLKGEQIPMEGRITAAADVYDALCSERAYKPRYSLEKSLEIMLSERGTRFDPNVLDAFCERLPAIEKIRKKLSDD
jgi:putative two-component system response regulator